MIDLHMPSEHESVSSAAERRRGGFRRWNAGSSGLANSERRRRDGARPTPSAAASSERSRDSGATATASSSDRATRAARAFRGRTPPHPRSRSRSHDDGYKTLGRDTRRDGFPERAHHGCHPVPHDPPLAIVAGVVPQNPYIPFHSIQFHSVPLHSSTNQHRTTQHNTTQHNTTQRNATQHNTTQHSRT